MPTPHDKLCEHADVGSLCDCHCAGAKHAIAHTKGGVPGAGAVSKAAQKTAHEAGRAAVVNNRAQPKDGSRVSPSAPKSFTTGKDESARTDLSPVAKRAAGHADQALAGKGDKQQAGKTGPQLRPGDTVTHDGQRHDVVDTTPVFPDKTRVYSRQGQFVVGNGQRLTSIPSAESRVGKLAGPAHPGTPTDTGATISREAAAEKMFGTKAAAAKIDARNAQVSSRRRNGDTVGTMPIDPPAQPKRDATERVISRAGRGAPVVDSAGPAATFGGKTVKPVPAPQQPVLDAIGKGNAYKDNMGRSVLPFKDVRNLERAGHIQTIFSTGKAVLTESGHVKLAAQRGDAVHQQHNETVAAAKTAYEKAEQAVADNTAKRGDPLDRGWSRRSFDLQQEAKQAYGRWQLAMTKRKQHLEN